MENDKQAHKISPKIGRGLGHVTHTIFGSTVGYPSDSLASCSFFFWLRVLDKAEYSAFESTLNSAIVSCRIV